MICCIPAPVSSRPFLSICIPTWNRSAELATQLVGLIPHISDRIEIVVVDNGSDDDTLDVVRRIASDNPQARLTLWSNEVNLGADVNYLRSLELGQGEWLWLLGDDDLINHSHIPLLKEKLEACRAGIAFFYHHRLKLYAGKEPTISSAEFFSSRHDDMSYWIHKIGFVAIRRDAAQRTFKKAYAQGIGTLHAHSIVILGMIDDQQDIAVFDMPALFGDFASGIVEAPRWGALHGVLGAWRATEVGLASSPIQVREREIRTRTREIYRTVTHQMAASQKVQAKDLLWVLRKVSLPHKLIVSSLYILSKMPLSVSGGMMRMMLRSRGRQTRHSTDYEEY